jgi:hypothetical protein
VHLERAVYAVLIDADERGLTRADARLLLAEPASGMDYKSQTAPIGAAYGLRADWAIREIAAYAITVKSSTVIWAIKAR